MKQNAESQYLETSILTATPEMLVVKLYDGLVQFTRIAIDTMKSKPSDIQTIHDNLRKAQRACAILMSSLDFEVGGEVATNLFALYKYWHRELMSANMKQDYSVIEELLPTFMTYRKTWSKAIEIVREERSSQKSDASGLPGDKPFARAG